MPADARDEPLVLAGKEYAYNFSLSGVDRDGVEAWPAVERVVVSAVIWDDGLVEGDRAVADQERTFRPGRAAEVKRVVAVFRWAVRDPHGPSLTDLRARIEALPVMDSIRNEALSDLDSYRRAHGDADATALKAWLAETISAYEEWVARLRVEPW